MHINGHRIKTRLREFQTERDALQAQFTDSLLAFPGDTKPTPENLDAGLLTLERKIATLQTLQDRYNLDVQVVVVQGGEPIALALAINVVGGLERAAKRWKAIATGKNDERSYFSRSEVRKDDERYREPTVDAQRALVLVKKVDRDISADREAIMIGNTVPLDLPDALGPTLFSDS